MYYLCKWSDISLPVQLRSVLDLRHTVCRLTGGLGWIAGGALRSRIAQETEPSDYDCYFKSKNDVYRAFDKVLNDSELSAKVKIDDDRLISLDTTMGKVDLIKTPFSSVESCLDSFDFTICCFAIDSYGRIYWSKSGLKHLKERKLVLYRPTCPFGTLLRLQKYASKGYLMGLHGHKMLADMLKGADYNSTFERLSQRGHAY